MLVDFSYRWGWRRLSRAFSADEAGSPARRSSLLNDCLGVGED